MKSCPSKRLLPALCLIVGLLLHACGGGGGAGSDVSGTPFRYDPGLPAAVTGAQAASGDQVVTVSWSSVYVATSYNIYYAARTATGGVPASGWSKISISGNTSYAVWGLTNNVTYYFVVTAVDKDGEGEGAPQGLTVPGTAVTATPGPIARPT